MLHCIQGASHGRGLTLLAFALLLAASPSAWAQEDKLPSGEKILDKSIKGRGGREAFEKLQSRVSKGSLEIAGGKGQPAKLPVALYEAAPNLQHRSVELGGGKTAEFGSDGDVCWELQDGKARIKEEDEKAISERDADFYNLINWRDYYDSVECVGKVAVDGRSCYKVVLKPKVGPVETRYFDRSNGLPIKSESTRKLEKDEVPVEYLMEDYREVDGVKLPFRIVRKMGSGAQVQTMITAWDSIEHNSGISDDEFKLPAAVKTLADKAKKTVKPPAAGKGRGG